MEEIEVKNITEAIPSILRFPAKEFYVDYDKEADVLYIGFTRPQNATDTDVTDNGILIRYRDNEIVGVTVLNASRWLERDVEFSGK